MKHRLIIISVLFIFFGINACTKIDQKIYDTQTTNNIKTQADVDLAILGLYAQFNSWSGFKEQFPLEIPLFADDLSSISGQWGTKLGITPSTTNIYNFWSRYYQAISNANAVIAYADSLKLTDTYKAKARAEAKFIRGLSYFYLVQYFGRVPITTTVFNYQSDFKPKRSSVDSVYNLIFSDLAEGITALPTRTNQVASEFNRATQGAAQGFLAKAYLTYGNYLDLNHRAGEAQIAYSHAKAQADSLIAYQPYQLMTDYAKLWDINNEKNAYNEVIFGIAYTRDYSLTDVTCEGSNFATFFNPTSRANICGNPKNGIGTGRVKVQPWLIERYTQGDFANSKKDTIDYRVETSFLTTWADINGKTRFTFPFTGVTGNIAESQPYINKYKDPNGVAIEDNENDLFLLRLSEIYLIAAEAENEMNGPANALGTFNKVRQRARNANGISRTLPADLNLSQVSTKEAMRMKIFDERGLEFVGELNRWFDLVRMRYSDNIQTMYEYQFGTFLPSLTPGLPTYTAKTKVWSAGRTESTNIIPFDRKYLLLPIPNNELAVNANLKIDQNPGW